MSVLFPFEELMFSVKETKVFTPVTLLLFILSINAIKLVDEDISTRSIYNENVVRLLVYNDFIEVKGILANEIVEYFLDIRVIANIIMRHLKRPFAKLIALQNIPDIGIEQKLDHLWISEATSLVHWIVTILVLSLFLFFNQLHVRGVFKVFTQDKPDNFFLVVLNGD